MKINLTQVGPTLRDEDVRHAELSLGVVLPLDYVRFLFENNGGWAGDLSGSYCFPIYGLSGEDKSSIHVMHGVYRTADDAGIVEATKRLIDRLPNGVIKIGYDAMGSWILLGTLGRYQNRVMFRVPDEEVLGDPNSGLFDIADTFTEFLDSIWYEVNEIPPDGNDA